MYAHHQATIQRTIDHFQTQPWVLALLLGGSIAHGFAQETSDVDIMIVVSDSEHQQRLQMQELAFFSAELSTYPGGYVDGKYISQAFLSQVEQRGSEPARFAFADAQILFSKLPNLEDQLQRIARYPVEDKIARIKRFHGQFIAWNWFAGEGFKKQNSYLITTAVSKLLLFGGRMVLAHNELLYPYHKWFMTVLSQAPDKPDGMLQLMQTLTEQPTPEHVTAFYELVKGFRDWELDGTNWGNQFMKDTELTWMDGTTVVDDL